VSIQDKPLFIVISGHICRDNSEGIKSFWKGFIELQTRLPSDRTLTVLGHHWNPEWADLVKFVYGTNNIQSEVQKSFFNDFVNTKVDSDFFESNLDRSHSTWKNVSLQSVIGNVRSRSKAVEKLLTLPNITDQSQILMTRWDLGQSGTNEVNKLIFDSSLPLDYIYIAYFSEVDEGYADMWVICPYKYAILFKDLDKFFVDSLNGLNGFIELFTQKGWPLSSSKIIHSSFEKIFKFKLFKAYQRINHLLIKHDLLSKFSVLEKVFRRFGIFVKKPLLSAENTLIYEEDIVDARRIFPSFQALNIHAIYKHFIIESGLRDKVRFLDVQDFEIDSGLGNLIAPSEINLVLLEQNLSLDTIDSIFKKNPLHIKMILTVKDGCLYSYEAYGSPISIKVFNPNDCLIGSICDYLVAKFDCNCAPVVVVDSYTRYLECSDWPYFNALIKYFFWTKQTYIGLDKKFENKVESCDFPFLGRANKPLYFNLCMLDALYWSYLIKDTGCNLDDIAVKHGKLNFSYNELLNKTLFA